jgi:hypothetical protein
MTKSGKIILKISIKEALQLDAEDGTNYCRCTINKEMSKVKVAWKAHDGYTPDEVRHGKAPDLIGFKEI